MTDVYLPASGYETVNLTDSKSRLVQIAFNADEAWLLVNGQKDGTDVNWSLDITLKEAYQLKELLETDALPASCAIESAVIEIERKFLVAGAFKHLASGSVHICQGYLSSNPRCTIRVRIKGDRGILTIKGAGNASGMSRFEWEVPIEHQDAVKLMSICEPGVIDKVRYLVKEGNHTFEVDEFHGENLGLVIAEVEVSHEGEVFARPTWLGDEVTGDDRYYNSALVRHSFCRW